MQNISEQQSTVFGTTLTDNDLDSIVSDMLLNNMLPSIPNNEHSYSPTELDNFQGKQGRTEGNDMPISGEDHRLINPTDLLNLQYTFDADMDTKHNDVVTGVETNLSNMPHHYSQPQPTTYQTRSLAQERKEIFPNSDNASNNNSPMSDLKNEDRRAAPRDSSSNHNELNHNIDSILRFGKRETVDTSFTDPEPFISADETSLPLSIQISGLPTVSRVENQLKLKIVLRRNKNAPSELLANKRLIHLPTASIAREKFYLLNDDISSYPITIQNQILRLDAFLLSNTHSNRSIYVCDRCVKRELKRASRRKSGLSDNLLWCNNPNRRAIIFNNKQMVSISDVSADGSQLEFDLVARIVCFCRHHKENDGFRIMFIIRDVSGLLLGRAFAGPIVIKDKKLKQPLDSKKGEEEEEVGVGGSTLTSTPSSLPVSNSSVSQESDDDDRRISESNAECDQTDVLSQVKETNSFLFGINDLSQFALDMFSLNPFGLNIPSYSSSSASTAVTSNTNNNSNNNNIGNINNNPGKKDKGVVTISNSPHDSPQAKGLSRSSSISSHHPGILNTTHKSNSIPNMRHFHFPSPTSMSEDDNNYNGTNSGSVKNGAVATGNARKRSRLDSENQALLLTPGNNSTILKSNSNVNVSSQGLLHPPVIQKVIPSQGPLNGGIEVTLLGKHFKDGLIVKFGENTALSTRCWNDSTLVTYLPPSATTGPVFVTISSPSLDDAEMRTNSNHFQMNGTSSNANDIENNNYGNTDGLGVIFTYIDDTDRQLIELALQIVGLRMNGKLEDARNIAKRIVEENNNNNSGNGNGSNANANTGSSSVLSSHGDFGPTRAQHNSYLVGNHRSHSSTISSNEALIIDVIKAFTKRTVDLNLSMCDEFGRTLLHHAALKSYYKLAKLLISYGAHVEKRDLFGFTPFHFACISGDMRIVDMLRNGCAVDTTSRTLNGLTGSELLWRNHRVTLSKSRHAVMKMPVDIDNRKDAEEEGEFDEEGEGEEEDNSSTVSFSSTNSSVQIGFSVDTSLHSNYGHNLTDLENFADESGGDITFDDSEEEEAELEDGNDRNIEVNNGNRGNIEESPRSISMWNRVLKRLNDEILPRYEDLFPRSTSETIATDSAVKSPIANPRDNLGTSVYTTPLVSDNDVPKTGHLKLVTESRFTGGRAAGGEEGEEEEEEAEDVFTMNAFGSFFTQKRKDLQSDKMLFFFWMPLTVILLCSMAVYKLGKDDNLVQYVGDGISKYLRIGLSKVVLGNERVKASFKNQFSNLQISTKTVNGLKEGVQV